MDAANITTQKTCPTCTKPFTPTGRHAHRHIYCSRRCRKTAYDRRVNPPKVPRTAPDQGALIEHGPTGWLVEPTLGHVYTPHQKNRGLERVAGSRTGWAGNLSSVRNRGDERTPWLLKNVVWEAVHGDRPKGKYVRILNGDQTDLRIANLELYDLDRRLRETNMGARSPLTEPDVLVVWRSHGTASAAEMASRFGVSRKTIWRIRAGRSWRSVTKKLDN